MVSGYVSLIMGKCLTRLYYWGGYSLLMLGEDSFIQSFSSAVTPYLKYKHINNKSNELLYSCL